MLEQLISFINGMLSERQIVFSASMMMLLNKMKHPIAKDLIDAVIKQKEVDNSYVDIAEEEGMVSFLPHKKADVAEVRDEMWTDKNRQITRIGRLITAFLLKLGKSYSQEDISNFVNEFKSYQKEFKEEQIENAPKTKMYLVSGEDIRYWYLGDNYKYYDKGTLGSSCMRHDDKQDYFDVYVENSNIEMLVYTEKNGEDEKLLGRAIVWKDISVSKNYQEEVGAPTITFMDRIYCAEDYMVETFKKYAEEQGWWYKETQDFTSRAELTNGKIESMPFLYFYLDSGIDYSRRLKPYIDTISFYNKDENYLSNRASNSSQEWKSQDGGPNQCPVCNDSDMVKCESCDGMGDFRCDECSGSGEIECGTCDGQGEFSIINQMFEMSDLKLNDFFATLFEEFYDLIIRFFEETDYKNELISYLREIKKINISSVRDLDIHDFKTIENMKDFFQYSYPARHNVMEYLDELHNDTEIAKRFSHLSESCEDCEGKGTLTCKDCNSGRIKCEHCDDGYTECHECNY